MPCSTTTIPPASCIRGVPLFQQLEEADLRRLENAALTERHAKGSLVFRQGEPSDALYVVGDGVLKLTQLAENGKEHIVRFLFPGDFFGQFSPTREKRHYANAEAVNRSTVCRIRHSDLRPLLEQHPGMAFRFLLAISERLQQADEWAGAMHLCEVDQRMAKLILYVRSLQGASGGKLVLPAAKKEMAAMIGTTPETFSRKWARLIEEGIIAADRRTLRILDPYALRRIAGDSA